MRLAFSPCAWSLVAVLGAPTLISAQDVALPKIFGDGMVLQRLTEAPIWGTAAPNAEVKVTADWPEARAATVRTDKGGRFLVKLQTPQAGGPYTVTVTCGGASATLNDVLVGEVWVCSGQSNMEWRVRQSTDAEKEIAAADWPKLRLFTVRNVASGVPRDDCEGEWVTCSKDTVASFSAVGYYFGRELFRELDVPLGLISSDWGGTPAESWTSGAGLAGFDAFAPALAQLALLQKDPDEAKREYENALASWRREFARAEKGTADRWESPDFDDSKWQVQKAPGTWAGDLEGFDGVVWHRRVVEISDAWAEQELVLSLGPIDDQDVTWVNGVRVGATENWQAQRRYTVPASALRPGKNVVAVRVYDTGGGGGFHGKPGDMTLGPKDGKALAIAGDWKFHPTIAHAKLPQPPRSQTSVGAWTPSGLFNGMIAPLVPLAIRGAIWYQGESNRDRADQYEKLFPAMITDWRRHWGIGDFPFYFVQIAPFNYGGDTGEAAALRDAQRKTLRLPNTGMAVTMDIGNPRDIHPKNKQDVGKRLALWALAKTYGKEGLVYSGPLYRSMKVEGDKIRLEFDHVGGGLASGDAALSHFMIAGADQKFVPATAVIDGATIVVSSPDVKAPVAVRFAWGATDQPNLKNKEGLPASSFRTDDW